MENIATKTDNISVLPASQFNNNLRNELQNSVTTSGQSLSAANLNQLGQAMGRYGSGGGDFYQDSGSTNSYFLTGVGSFIKPAINFDGKRAVFIAASANTGPSTINVGGIGSVDLKDSQGNALTNGFISAGEYYTIVFNSSAGEYRIITSSGLPAGSTMYWSFAIEDIPAGWAICDGNNGTLNAIDAFIRSAGGTYAVGATGGSETTGSHAITEAEMPTHTHPYTKRTGTTGRGDGVQNASTNSDTGATTSATGGGNAHSHPNTVPPFLAIPLIMKL